MTLRLGLILALVLAASSICAEQIDENRPAILVRAVDPAGKLNPVVYLTLWRAMEPAEAEPANRLDGSGSVRYYDPVIWDDRTHNVRWTRDGSANPNDGRHGWEERAFHFRELKPGRYRVTAVTYRQSEKTPDPSPYGVSELITYDGRTPVATDVVLAPGNARATVRVIDAQTKKPIPGIGLRLRSGDGMPIVHGHGNGNFFERASDEGEVRFAQLKAEEFTLQLLGLHAQVNNFVEYAPVAELRRINVKPGENTFEIAVEPRALPQAEIDQRFPFSIFGRVADEAGNPLGGVEVRAATGMGTLLGGGRTTTAADGKYRLYFGPGMHMQVDPVHAPRGVGVQAAHFFANKPGWKLNAPDGYVFYLMSDQTRAQFEAMLREEGGKYWGKDSANEVIFASQPRELNLTLKRDEAATR